MSVISKTPEEIAAYWADQVALFEAQAKVAWPSLVEASKEIGNQVPVATGAGVPLLVNSVGYGKVPVESVLDRTAAPVNIVATQDGRGVILDWHQGPSDIDAWVYYERWENGLRLAHGYVDPTTRKIVQSG